MKTTLNTKKLVRNTACYLTIREDENIITVLEMVVALA